MYMSIHTMCIPASKNVSDWWLAYWISHSHDHPGVLLNTTSPHSTLHTTTPLTDYGSSNAALLYDGLGSGDHNTTVLREAGDNLQFYLGVYGGLAVANSVSSLNSFTIWHLCRCVLCSYMYGHIHAVLKAGHPVSYSLVVCLFVSWDGGSWVSFSSFLADLLVWHIIHMCRYNTYMYIDMQVTYMYMYMYMFYTCVCTCTCTCIYNYTTCLMVQYWLSWIGVHPIPGFPLRVWRCVCC